jgi:hypothetical protein
VPLPPPDAEEPQIMVVVVAGRERDWFGFEKMKKVRR